MSYLKGLDSPRMIQPSQVLANSPLVNTVPKPVGEVGNVDFFHPLLEFVMTSNNLGMLTMFLKLKSLVFLCLEIKDSYEFILHCYERLHKFGIVHNHGVEFISFQLQGASKQL